MLKSEGSEYNIISLSKSIDGELSIDSAAQKSLSKVRTHVIEKELQSRGESMSDLTVNRARRRISDQRRLSHLQFGYLPIDKVPSHGVSAWDRVRTSPSEESSLVRAVRGDTRSLDSRPRMDEHSSISSLTESTLQGLKREVPRENLTIDISKVEFGEPIATTRYKSSTRDSRRAATTGKMIPLVRSSGFDKKGAED